MLAKTNELQFFLNGKLITIQDPNPDTLLIDYLRSSEVALTGAKKGCGQGGCGACTVILSEWNSKINDAEHRSINSCLRPICSLGGLSVTTIEGTGNVGSPHIEFPNHAPTYSRGGGNISNIIPSTEWIETTQKLQKLRLEKLHKVSTAKKTINTANLFTVSSKLKNNKITTGDEHEGMNPVAHRLAINNGTQCGYCTTGFVMNMSSFLAANPKATKKEIEDIFDGNICRCTGYRTILTGMKTFASDWTEQDDATKMNCVTEDKCDQVMINNSINIPFPEVAKILPSKTQINLNKRWYSPENLIELSEIYEDNIGRTIRLVFGNTSIGIYKEEVESAHTYIDIKFIKELKGIEFNKSQITFGSATTYSELIDFLKAKVPDIETTISKRWGAIDFMGRRTAGMIVRNAASIGGNAMLVLHHIHKGEPFPSDLFTALAATECQIEFIHIQTGTIYKKNIDGLLKYLEKNRNLINDILLLRFFLPATKPNEITLAQKVALREVNSHSIVNNTSRIEYDKDYCITTTDLVFGGIAPFPWHPIATEALLSGSQLSLDRFYEYAQLLRKEVTKELGIWHERMSGLPTEGFTNEYKIELAVSFLYKFLVHAIIQTRPETIPNSIKSSGTVKWGNWPVTKGNQYFEKQNWRNPVGKPLIKLMAFHQAMGQIHYTHEIALPPIGKNAAFVQSKKALANYYFKLPQSDQEVNIDVIRLHLTEKFETFHEMLTYLDIPEGGHNLQGMGSDQPLFAIKEVSYVGQVISMIIADNEIDSIIIAEYASEYCIGYKPIDLGSEWSDEWKKPIISLDDAIKMNSIFPDAPLSAPFATHIWKITRPGTQLSWYNDCKESLDKTTVERTDYIDNNEVFVIENTQCSGGQIHFYMETQSCVAFPEDGDRIILHSSSQSPSAMHHTAAASIGSEQNKIEVSIRQLGGGYGGKTEQARFVAGPTAIAAKVLNIPIRLVLKREHDTAMLGKRHGYYGQYQIAVDNGENNIDNKGLIRGFKIKLWGDGGAFYDCSFVVSNCIQLRVDNAYNIKNFESQLDVCRTNTAPNTAMRAFGDIQGKILMENAIDDAAFSVKMDPYKLRLKNMYYQGDVTPFGQSLVYCYMRDVWDYCYKKSNYKKKVKAVDKFNKANKWRKQGVYMLPVKYGSGYNLVMIEQATAMVSIYSADGSIIINQGAVDMGQGAITQIEQVASYILNVPLELIQILSARTSVIPNPTSTGGSTGTAYNGEAVKQACEVMRARLHDFGYQLLKDNGNKWCKDQGINFWDYKEGWAKVITKKGASHTTLVWQNLVALASQYRIELVATFNAKIMGGTDPVPVMTYKSPADQPIIPFIKNSNPSVIGGEVDSFNGFTFSAACAVVEVDILTGETKILSTDLVYDMGESLNPAIDIGQVEGAFIQGVGYIMTEKMVFETEEENVGRLNTLNTWRYKPPAITNIPLELNTHLYPRSNSSNVPQNPNGLLSSKEVGEPPLVLASSVFFAMKDAIRKSRIERGLSGLFRLDAPATVQEVRRALEVKDKHMSD